MHAKMQGFAASLSVFAKCHVCIFVSHEAISLRPNALRLFHFELSQQEMIDIDMLDRGDAGRTCWRTDPLRMLTFD